MITDDTEMLVTDDIIPFETAKKLDESKCYLTIRNCQCVGTYDTNGRLYGDFTTKQYPCPTVWNTIKFFRKLFGIDVIIGMVNHSTVYMDGGRYWFKVFHNGRWKSIDADKAYREPEEAAIAGIDWVLDNLLKKEEKV